MAAMDTKKVFDLYFGQLPDGVAKATRAMTDRKELYDFEKSIGKQVFDMNADELFDMICTYRKYGKDGTPLAFNTYDSILSIYRSVWDFYSDNIEPIINPWYKKNMRGSAIVKRLSDGMNAANPNIVNTIIKTIRSNYEDNDEEFGKYLECIILLLYNGFSSTKEIVLLKEDMINFETKEVMFAQRTIKLSDRCFELLQFVHNLKSVKSWTHVYPAVSYHGGYFKLLVHAKSVDSIQELSEEEAGQILTRKISVNINKKYGVSVNSRMYYLFGFYEYIVNNVGEQRAREMITSYRVSEDTAELKQFAKQYGFADEKASYIKNALRPFIAES